MGQYYMVANVDRKEFLHPHKFGEGIKLMEFGCSSPGTMLGLAILLADGNGRGGGDLHVEDDVIGSWTGDRIVIAGDYADKGRFVDDADAKAWAKENPEEVKEGETPNLYAVLDLTYEDISEKVLDALAQDDYVREAFVEVGLFYKNGKPKRCRKCGRQLLSRDKGKTCGRCQSDPAV